jgi:hypothetical protein
MVTVTVGKIIELDVTYLQSRMHVEKSKPSTLEEKMYTCAKCKHDRLDHSRGACHSGQHGAVLKCECTGYVQTVQEQRFNELHATAGMIPERVLIKLKELLVLFHAGHTTDANRSLDPMICPNCDGGLRQLINDLDLLLILGLTGLLPSDDIVHKFVAKSVK